MEYNKDKKQYGLWKSPISPISVARGIKLTDVAWDDDGTLIWRERRDGRGILVLQPPDGQTHRDLNNDYSASGHVGYGGGDFTVKDGFVYFVDSKTGRIFKQPTREGSAKPITPAFGGAAAPSISPDGKYMLFVHTYERVDSLGIVGTEGNSWPHNLVTGDDFYMQPTWHPSGKLIAWISWNHPNMPWDGTVLRTAALNFDGDGLPTLGEAAIVTGSSDTSVFQPEFSPDGRYLAYVSDESGWWQIYVVNIETGKHNVLTDGDAEHGLPAWVQGYRTYGFNADSQSIYFTRMENGFASLWQVDLESKVQTRVEIGDEYTWMEQIAVSPKGDEIAVIASGGDTPHRLVTKNLTDGMRILRRTLPEDLPTKSYSLPKAITWKGMDSEDIHGLYYAPKHLEFDGIGKPPLIVLVHGGPTGQRYAAFYPEVQFFTSRGYAVLQVNYRGSSGYGRAYRDALKGKWGIYDVKDSVSGALNLANEGLVDRKKLVIMGGSAGGFTVLKALEDHPRVFKAGICLYGVANQFTLVTDTHKFEERYSDGLLGSLPEAADNYRKQSPVFFADQIRDAVIVFQGEEDKVVPQNQSEEIVAALRRNGVPHEYHLYPGEGHGFRKIETLEHFYKTVEKFLIQNVIFA